MTPEDQVLAVADSVLADGDLVVDRDISQVDICAFAEVIYERGISGCVVLC